MSTIINYPKMEPHSNGVVVKWEEVKPNKNGDTYAPGCRKDCSKVYEFSEADESGKSDKEDKEDKMKEAMTHFMDLSQKSKSKNSY